nr:MAG TPA: hypothetical protein [Caudoviricetes sp.]
MAIRKSRRLDYRAAVGVVAWPHFYLCNYIVP